MKKHLRHASVIAALLLACGWRLAAQAEDGTWPGAQMQKPATFRAPAF